MTSPFKREAKQGEATVRTAIWPEGIPRGAFPHGPAIKAGGFVFVGADSTLAAINEGNPYLSSALEREALSVLSTISATLAAAGCDLRKDAVRSYQWLPSERPTYEEFLQGSSTTTIRMDPYNRVFTDLIDEPRPASIAVGVRRLLRADSRVGVEVIAMEPRPGLLREGAEIPSDVPQPIVRYSPALRSGDWVFLAGDIATDFRGDFKTSDHLGEPSALAAEARVNPYFWYGSPIEAQMEYVLSKLERIAEAAGASLNRCVKAEIYIGHPQDWYGIDRVWKRWFPEEPPARVVVPYMGLAGWGCRVEVALTLLASKSHLTIETIETSDAPQPLGHEPQAVKAGELVFFSTQMAFDSSGNLAPETKRHPEFPWCGQPAKMQMRYMLDNVAAISEAAGTTLDNLCRGQCFFDDFSWFAEAIQDEWAAHFPGDKPATTTIETGGPLLVPGAHVLLDLISFVPG